MRTTRKTYLSAAGKDWLLPFYDPFTRLLGIEAVHNKLIRQAAIRPGHRILEIGCGTGNLAILAKKLNPATEIVGIDPDPKALARARQKAQQSKAILQFDSGFSEELPYPDASFDRVLSAFMLHHVKPERKPLALREAFRLLKPDGSLHLVDLKEGQHRAGGIHGFHAPGKHFWRSTSFDHRQPDHRPAPDNAHADGSAIDGSRFAGHPSCQSVPPQSEGHLPVVAAPRLKLEREGCKWFSDDAGRLI